jgi:hypothetical protein
MLSAAKASEISCSIAYSDAFATLSMTKKGPLSILSILEIKILNQ